MAPLHAPSDINNLADDQKGHVVEGFENGCTKGDFNLPTWPLFEFYWRSLVEFTGR
jgi:hypothetical protein